ncbi:MAG: carbohydrate kinase family protein [Kiritimatiellia bacterium]|nr:carbohydrate kinase family protein [Kiritimatiellia bacterium]
MPVDILVLNTAVIDYRGPQFCFLDDLVGKGGLAKCEIEDMPDFSQEEFAAWNAEGNATAGGPGNTAPLMSAMGLDVAVGVNLGKGEFDGLDAQGRYFHDVMAAHDVDMSETCIHPGLPTGTTFIHCSDSEERGGIGYFPGANHDFDFEQFKGVVERLRPRIVYYMYSGLSKRGDANGGKDLADFIAWCRRNGALTIVDSHTLASDPEGLISSGEAVPEYKLLEPILPELDIFFTSSDEAKMIENTIGARAGARDGGGDIPSFLQYIAERCDGTSGRTRLLGVTVSHGAHEKHIGPGGSGSNPRLVESRFMTGEVVDLVGAGDSFRAGLLTYVANNLEQFRDGTMDFTEAVQAGNLVASLYIKASLADRYSMPGFERVLEVIRGNESYPGLTELKKALGMEWGRRE